MEPSSFAALAEVLIALRSLEIPNMVVGSFSCNAYAMPRSTKDADIVVLFQPEDLNRIVNATQLRFLYGPAVKFRNDHQFGSQRVDLPSNGL